MEKITEYFTISDFTSLKDVLSIISHFKFKKDVFISEYLTFGDHDNIRKREHKHELYNK